MTADAAHGQRFAFWAGVCIGSLLVTMLLVLTLIAVLFTERRSQRGAVSAREPRTAYVVVMRALQTGTLRRSREPRHAPVARRREIVASSLLREGL